MDKKIKDLLANAKNPEDVVRIATKYGYNTEIKKNKELNESELKNISGGKTETSVRYASYSVVVRDKTTGEILAVLPY